MDLFLTHALRRFSATNHPASSPRVSGPPALWRNSGSKVAEVGKNVKHVKPGDRVAIEPGKSCRICTTCKAGLYHLCPDMRFAATPPFDGTLARYYTVPADLAYPLPPNMTLEDGALVIPLPYVMWEERDL